MRTRRHGKFLIPRRLHGVPETRTLFSTKLIPAVLGDRPAAGIHMFPIVIKLASRLGPQIAPKFANRMLFLRATF